MIIKKLKSSHIDTITHIGKSLSPSAVNAKEGVAVTTNQRIPVYIWLQPTTIFDARLSSQDKQSYMNEAIVMSYREAAWKGLGGDTEAGVAVDFVLDTIAAVSPS